jgi:putative ABC transport system substrate-binding protein
MIRRREFITVLGGAVAWPLAVHAQEYGKLPIIGFLGAGTPATAGTWVAAFMQRLRELGWIEDRTIRIDLRWAEGRNDRSAQIAADFVRLKVDVIATYSSEHAQIAKQTTSTIPIVAALIGDPVGSGLVNSIARTDGNLTGLSSQNVDLVGKRFELLREIVPGLRRLGMLFNSNNPGAAPQTDAARTAAGLLGFDVVVAEIRRAEDIGSALTDIAKQADALFVVGDPLTFSQRIRLSTLTLGARLPTMYANREYVEAGGLLSYGPNYQVQFRRAADYVHRILGGTKPGELPIEQPTHYDLVINLTTAKALGLEIPPTLLARADEVIE